MLSGMTVQHTQSSDFSVRFWGVRGTMPVTDPDYARIGGNTSCVEVMCGAKRFILDAGTGIVGLGKQLPYSLDKPIDILLSHTHIDHILGLLYFAPLYDANAHIRVFAGHLLPDDTLAKTLSKLMSPPIFPIAIEQVHSQLETVDFEAGARLAAPYFTDERITIRTLPLHHPDRATGYRIEYKGKSVCYITDIEHDPGQLDPALLQFIDATDYLIYDSTYDDEEFKNYQGWGHSTWQHAIRLAESANVKRLALYHHHPEVNDINLSIRQNFLKNKHIQVDVSHEGMAITL